MPDNGRQDPSGNIERWYVCENCHRIGPMRDFQDECRRGSTHGPLTKVDMESPALAATQGAVAEIGRLRTWIDVQGRECPSASSVDLELRDSASRFPTTGGQ